MKTILCGRAVALGLRWSGGAPRSPAPPDRKLGVTLVAIEVKGEAGKPVARGEPFPAQVNPVDGTFVVPGRDGAGIPPGRYRVAIAQRPTDTAVSAAQAKAGKKASPINRETDFFKNRFSAEDSPIVRDLEASCELIIDLDHPTEDRAGAPR
jgi:hypothetical protein